MRLDLDDDLDSNALIGLLRQADHDVVSPRVAGTRGNTDEDHLGYAAAESRVLLTANAGNFVTLHERWRRELRGHSGILIVYRENNPERDMSFRQIADAVAHLERSGAPTDDVCHNLNFWRQRSA